MLSTANYLNQTNTYRVANCTVPLKLSKMKCSVKAKDTQTVVRVTHTKVNVTQIKVKISQTTVKVTQTNVKVTLTKVNVA